MTIDDQDGRPALVTQTIGLMDEVHHRGRSTTLIYDLELAKPQGYRVSFDS
jgi:hypothetical protein